MNNSKKSPDFPLSLVLLAAMTVLMAVLAPYRLAFKEQTGIFAWTPERISWYISNPAVISQILGDWLTQFYMNSVAAVVISVLLLKMVWSATVRLTRLACGRPRYILSMLPVVVAGAFLVWPDYPVAGVVGMILSLRSAYTVAKVSNPVLKAVCIGLGIPVLFVLLGNNALLFGLACCLAGGGRLRNNLMALAAGLAVMFILAWFYNLTFVKALVYPAPVGAGYLVCRPALLMLIPLSVVATLVASRWNNRKAAELVWTFCCVAVLSTSYSDKLIEFSTKVGTLAYRSDWKAVRECASEHLDIRYGLFYRNLSYAREGTLPDNLLSCPQTPDGLFLETTTQDLYLSLFFYPDALLEMGDISRATDCALFGQTVMPGYNSTRMLRRLAEIAVTAGDYEVAMKYLDILSRTRNHRAWADELKGRIISNNIPDKYLVWRGRASETDFFFPLGNDMMPLVGITANRRSNKVAADYLLCYLLLQKRISTFRAYYDDLWLDGLDRRYEVPELYQQALLLEADSQESLELMVERYNISGKVVERYFEFMEAVEKAGEGNMEGLEQFKGTYWYQLCL